MKQKSVPPVHGCDNRKWKCGCQSATLYYYSLICDGGLFNNQLFILACFNNDFWVGFFFLIIFECGTV